MGKWTKKLKKPIHGSEAKYNFCGIILMSGPPLLMKVVGTFLTFALSIFLARTLGISEFGVYAFIVSVVMILSIPTRSGIQTLAARETAKALADENILAISLLIRWSNRIILVYSLLIFFAVFCAWIFIRPNVFLDGLLVAVISIGTISLLLRNSAVLRGFKCFAKGTAPDIVVRPFGQLVALMLILVVIPSTNVTAQIGLAAFTVASLVAWIISAIWLGKELTGADKVKSDKRTVDIPSRKSLLFLTIAGGGQVLFGQIDTLVLGILGAPEQVGAYRASVQFSMLLVFVLTVINQVIQPEIVRLYRLKNFSGMQSLVYNSSYYMFLASLALGTVMIIFTSPLIELTFGSDFKIASTALQILVIGQLINVLFGPVGTILNMTGMEKEAMTSIIIAILVNIILDFALIPFFGMIGAASASMFSIFVWNMVSRHYVKISLGIESSGVIQRLKRNTHRQ